MQRIHVRFDRKECQLETLIYMQMYSAIPILYPFNILAIKLSFLLLYLRLFGVQRTFRLVIFWAIAIQSFFYTGYFTYQVVYFNVCSRVDQHSIPFCLSTSQVVVSQGAFNVVTDFVILALPIRKVLALHLKRAQKFNLCLVFASGFMLVNVMQYLYKLTPLLTTFLVLVVSVLRDSYFLQYAMGTLIRFTGARLLPHSRKN